MQILMSRRPPGDGEVTVMRDITERIDALSELINDLMVFARPRPPQPSTFDLTALLEEAVVALRRDPLGAALDVTLDGPSLMLTADAELIRATVLNLLLNAAQAMGGAGRIAIAISQHDERAVIEVRDTGPGIPPDIRARVFEPFFTTKARGGGLGLPIARRTAELHNGSLTLTCPEEGGTIMTLTLPLRLATAPRDAIAGAPDRTSRSDTEPGRD